MDLAEGIRKIGFRRWYERQLIESHLYFVTGFLSMIMVAACVEEFNIRAPGWQPFLMLGLIAGGAALCFWSLARYRGTLDRAEHAAERSTCSQCVVYSGLEVLQSSGEWQADNAPWLRVRCRKCGYEWTIE